MCEPVHRAGAGRRVMSGGEWGPGAPGDWAKPEGVQEFQSHGWPFSGRVEGFVMVSPVSGWAVVVGALEAEGAERVEQAVRVLEVHVVPGGAGLAVAALKEQYFLGDPGGDCRGEATLAGRDAGEALDVGPAGVKDAPECVAEHLP